MKDRNDFVADEGPNLEPLDIEEDRSIVETSAEALFAKFGTSPTPPRMIIDELMNHIIDLDAYDYDAGEVELWCDITSIIGWFYKFGGKVKLELDVDEVNYE